MSRRLAALLAVNLGFALRATPGNVGLFQAAYAASAVASGFDKEQAIAVAFLIQVQQILPVTALGVARRNEKFSSSIGSASPADRTPLRARSVSSARFKGPSERLSVPRTD